MQPGQEGYYVLLHELAHALGLQHPLPSSDKSGAPILSGAMATASNTIMLDLDAKAVAGVWPTWYGGYDLQALRGLYGTKSFASGNNTYYFDDATLAKFRKSALEIAQQFDIKKILPLYEALYHEAINNSK